MNFYRMKIINKILVLIVSIGCFFSCGEDEQTYTIPQSAVNLTVNLNGADNILNTLYAYKTYESVSGQTAYTYLGYAGILLFCADINSEGIPVLNAFDLCCPYEDNRNVKVTPTQDRKAVCSKCKSEYDLLTGMRISGPSTERLQSYRVSYEVPYYGKFVIRN